MTNVAQDPEQRVKNIENIESDSLRARWGKFALALSIAFMVKS